MLHFKQCSHVVLMELTNGKIPGKVLFANSLHSKLCQLITDDDTKNKKADLCDQTKLHTLRQAVLAENMSTSNDTYF